VRHGKHCENFAAAAMFGRSFALRNLKKNVQLTLANGPRKLSIFVAGLI
jgi:hypothetical protein